MLCDPLSVSCLGWERSHRPQFIEGIDPWEEKFQYDKVMLGRLVCAAGQNSESSLLI